MTDMGELSLRALLKANSSLIKGLVRLCKFGDPVGKHKGKGGPFPDTFKEATDAAKIRLDALKLWSSITFGTKSHGGIPVDDDTRDSIARTKAIKAFKNLPAEQRESLLEAAVEQGELTEDEADEIRGKSASRLQPDARTEGPAETETGQPAS